MGCGVIMGVVWGGFMFLGILVKGCCCFFVGGGCRKLFWLVGGGLLFWKVRGWFLFWKVFIREVLFNFVFVFGWVLLKFVCGVVLLLSLLFWNVVIGGMVGGNGVIDCG